MDRIFAEAAKLRGEGSSEPSHSQKEPSQSGPTTGKTSSDLPKGVVLGPDGKPCRTCTSTAAWSALVRSQRKEQAASSAAPASASLSTLTGAASAAAAPAGAISSDADAAADAIPALPADCPPDVDRLGRHTWTLLHGMAAAYPERATAAQQADMRGFLALFGRLYPCWSCASDFRDWMGRPGNAPRVDGREPFGRWMCAAHNEVNRKLGKREFDCARWRERWLDGWKDGRCDP